MANILIIDDDIEMCLLLTTLVERAGHQSFYRETLEQGLQAANTHPFDVVFLDINMPDGNGLEILSSLQQTPSNPEVIIITGYADIDSAEIALKNGAWDYIQKSDSPKKLILPLQRVIKYREGLEQAPPAKALIRDGIIGTGPAIKNSLDLLAQASNNPVNVLITGKTGTGKELFAKAIHMNSERSQNRFIVVDCAALPETLVESILFGHAKGAFTGADSIQGGLIGEADGGTLFLDEVGELPLLVQKSFLRVLQERCYRPVGGKKEIKSDFRIIAATNQNLEEMIQKDQFRNDLLYRLKTLQIHLPSLKARCEDITDIVLYHVKIICERYNLGTKGLSPEFMDVLKIYPWPGNVRELVHSLEAAINAAGTGPTLLPIHLPTHIRLESMRVDLDGKTNKEIIAPVMSRYRDVMDLTEKEYFKNLLIHTGGDIKKCCDVSGISRSRIYSLFKKHNLSKQ
jgi:two-component system NtrC family response regulator